MIYRTPISQADLARAAHGRRIRRVAHRNRAHYDQLNLRREMNALCFARGMEIPFPELVSSDNDLVAYAGVRTVVLQKVMAPTPVKRRGWLERLLGTKIIMGPT